MKTETEVLIQSRRRCCLCFGLNGDNGEKKGQIAHLDGDRTNNKQDNLAFLCFDHHDRLDSKPSQAKGLTVSEVKFYRDQLHKAMKVPFCSMNELPVRFFLVLQVDADDESTIEVLVSKIQELSEDTSVKLLSHSKGSLRLDFEGSFRAYRTLRKLQDSGELERQLGASVSDVSLREISEELVSKKNTNPDQRFAAFVASPNGNTVVCRLAGIEGCEQESKRAMQLLPPKTDRIRDCCVYITKVDGYLYLHSNFNTPGYDYTTKILTNQFDDLLKMTVNLIADAESYESVFQVVARAHETDIKYFIDESLLRVDLSFDIRLGGAKNVDIVVDGTPQPWSDGSDRKWWQFWK